MIHYHLRIKKIGSGGRNLMLRSVAPTAWPRVFSAILGMKTADHVVHQEGFAQDSGCVPGGQIGRCRRMVPGDGISGARRPIRILLRGELAVYTNSPRSR